MARAAVLGRLTWQRRDVAGSGGDSRRRGRWCSTCPTGPVIVAGQHVDVRLTAEDGYTAQRSYSIASAPDESTVELTVQAVPDGEVSSYLVDDGGAAGTRSRCADRSAATSPGDPTDPAPVLLVAGGSGIVPLMCDDPEPGGCGRAGCRSGSSTRFATRAP